RVCVCVCRDRPVWTRITREAWISSGVFGLSRPIQEFGLARFRSNQVKSMKGLEHALSNLQSKSSVHKTRKSSYSHDSVQDKAHLMIKTLKMQ
uniref:PRELI/MSF1 domain-containing protein n=1 Tax=Cyprinus carpio TaxID=7962 RepID=A0A8C1LTH3_CYPCA